MQNLVRRILGFVTQLVSRPADTTAADEAWWQASVLDIQEEQYHALGDWWSEPQECRCWLCGGVEVVPRYAWSKDHECQECAEVSCDGTDLDCNGCAVCEGLTVKVSL